MLAICYDPYSGTLGKFSRAEIFELVAEAGYEGINIPVNSAFLGDLSSVENSGCGEPRCEAQSCCPDNRFR